MGHGILEDYKGNKSNSRRIANIIIYSALIGVEQFILIKIFFPDVNLMDLATATGVLFGSIAGSALIFLFAQKKEEGKQLETETLTK